MNRITASAIVALLLAAGSLPASAEIFTNEDGKRVECKDEQLSKEGHPVAGPLLGAVVGGVIGNQFGSGSGKKLATAAGAIGGGVAGKNIDENRTEDQNRVRRVCREIG
ncbi:MAG: glycine zipper 2TM domain-containing protein [Panacagrimonas sp.]